MSNYYSEKKGLRKPKLKTDKITIDKYRLLLNCCEKYYNNLSWKYPLYCEDNQECIGVNIEDLKNDLVYEIPDLYKDDEDDISAPIEKYNVFNGTELVEYSQFALLDFIVFIANNIKDIEKKDYHDYWSHYHIKLLESEEIRKL